MPLLLDIRRRLTARSDRVKCVDQHPSEPWLLCSTYGGDVNIWNYETHAQIKRLQVCELPVRAAKFVPRKHWVVTGADDMQVRVFNYNTLEGVRSFTAHSDYVRCVVAHPAQPCILTCSDDFLIKLWNWDRDWVCQQVFESHTHYVMQIVINPKDTDTFASASLDTTVKVWQLGSAIPNFTLEGHQKGVNCVDYYHREDKPYLVSGGDDRLVKIWDYQNKTCVQTVEGHRRNVSAVCFHPELPILLTGSEDGAVCIWHADTYRLEILLQYGFERVWTVSCLRGSNNVAIGYDEGTIVIKVGREEPAVSMDVNGGKIIWAKHSELQQINLKALPEGTEIKDGEPVPVVAEYMCSCDFYPQSIAHSPNGRFVMACGDDDYIIYTAIALRSKMFGNAQQFAWAPDSSEYATLEYSTTVKVFKNFKEIKCFKPARGAEGVFGGFMLGVISGMTFSFYDWGQLKLIRRIEMKPQNVFWSESGSLVCLASDEAYYVLKYNADVVARARESNAHDTRDGIEEAFEVVDEVKETVKSGLWVGDCFIYTNSLNRVTYYVGGEIVTVSHLDRTMYILGYVAKESRLYLTDKALNIVSYSLLSSVLEYQTAVMRGDFETADRVLPAVPHDQRTRVAHFLEKQGFKQQALAVSTDSQHQFELALALGDLQRGAQLAEDAAAAEDDTEEGPSCSSLTRWSRLGIAAVAAADTTLTKLCYMRARNYSSLLLFAMSTGDRELLAQMARMAADGGHDNVAFIAFFALGELDDCLRLLVAKNKLPEAAFFARSYTPSKITEIVALWRKDVGATNEKTGQSLADPQHYENLFPEYAESLELEKIQRRFGYEYSRLANVPADCKVSDADRDFAFDVAALKELCPKALRVTDDVSEEVEEQWKEKSAAPSATAATIAAPPTPQEKRKDFLDREEEIERKIEEMALDEEEELFHLCDNADLND